ncbi:MAG: glycosyltransferase family 4 protein [Sulfuricaulis sp.]
MKVKIISCWFATSYGAYSDGLRKALERQLRAEVGIIATNCGCGDPVQVNRQFQDRRCDYFEFPNISYFKSANPVKYWLRNTARQVVYRERAKRYLARSDGADVIHFQQTLNAFGSVALFNWLALPSEAARVVTVHELDPDQQDFRRSSLKYNRADRIIVHSDEMKQSLVSLGVDSERIDVIEHGVEIRPIPNGARDGIVFYGGHKLHSGKGLETLLDAMALVKRRLGPNSPVLKIHGHYGTTTPEYGLSSASKAGVADDIRWLNQISLEATISEYQKSMLCVLPYTGSFAGFPAVNAMANGVTVIGTRKAGLPDHLGDNGVWIEANDSAMLANTIVDLLNDKARRQDIADKGRARAEKLFNWDAIAKRTIDSYERAVHSKKMRSVASG